MRKIPDSLLYSQQQQREQTISAVKAAIQELCAEGYPITVKRLCERTGLSRSVFSKPHVKAVLNEVKICSPSTKTVSDKASEVNCEKLRIQLERSKQREIELKSANVKLRETVQELRSECELLRGEVHTLMRQHEIHRPRGGE